MSAGDLWQLPDGRRGLEVEGSTRQWIIVMPIRDNWPFPLPPMTIPREMCQRLGSRYHGGAILEDARW